MACSEVSGLSSSLRSWVVFTASVTLRGTRPSFTVCLYYTYSGLLSFGTSAIPDDATIISAKLLELHQQRDPPHSGLSGLAPQ